MSIYLTSNIKDIYANYPAKSVYLGSQLVWTKDTSANAIGFFALTGNQGSEDDIAITYVSKSYDSTDVKVLSRLPANTGYYYFPYKDKLIQLMLSSSPVTYNIYQVTHSGLVNIKTGNFTQISTASDNIDSQCVIDCKKGYIYPAVGHFDKTVHRLIINSDGTDVTYDTSYGTAELGKGAYNDIVSTNGHDISNLPTYPVVRYQYGSRNPYTYEGFNLETKEFTTAPDMTFVDLYTNYPVDYNYTSDNDGNIYTVTRGTASQSLFRSYPRSETSGREDGVRVETQTNDEVALVGHNYVMLKTTKIYRIGTSSRDPVDYYKFICDLRRLDTDTSVWTNEYRVSDETLDTSPNFFSDDIYYCPWIPDTVLSLGFMNHSTTSVDQVCAHVFRETLSDNSFNIVSLGGPLFGTLSSEPDGRFTGVLGYVTE